MTTETGELPRQRYTWPWLVLGAFVLAVVLAVVWMSREFERARRIRDANLPPPAQTNVAAPAR